MYVTVCMSLHMNPIEHTHPSNLPTFLPPTPPLPNPSLPTHLIRVTVPMRECATEAAPLVGIRASPLGRHVMLLFKGGPSEIWAVMPRQRCDDVNGGDLYTPPHLHTPTHLTLPPTHPHTVPYVCVCLIFPLLLWNGCPPPYLLVERLMHTSLFHWNGKGVCNQMQGVCVWGGCACVCERESMCECVEQNSKKM